MTNPSNWRARIHGIAIAIVAVCLSAGIIAFTLTDLPLKLGISGFKTLVSGEPDNEDAHDDNHHEHDGHAEDDSIEISDQARISLNLQVAPVSVGTFTEYIEVPGMVTAWPGRTHISATSPLTGIINAIYVSRGELIHSGEPLFSLRLTHQDLVNSQEDFLTLLGELDVEDREIARLTKIAESGAIPGRTLINRQYERDKRIVSLRATRQSLLLHGLTEDQIQHIEDTRDLIHEVMVRAPELHADRSLHHDALEGTRASAGSQRDPRYASMGQPTPPHHEHIDIQFIVAELAVIPGASVATGQMLATLSDYSQLLIEGHAFQRDGAALRSASELQAPLQAILKTSTGQPEVIDDLKIAYIGNEVHRESRALPFYVALDNEIERSERRGGHRYVSWRYKPGQRLRLRVPIRSINDVIVVSKSAVAEAGPERYVFVENGDHFDRVPVSIVARDFVHMAIANDGQLWPGQSIAVNGAHQLQMALQNKSGGAIDPHAGHNH